MTLGAPGDASIAPPSRPDLVAAPWPRALDRQDHLGRRTSASWRRAIGTVPACPAWPATSMRNRLAPLIAVTTPTGSFASPAPAPARYGPRHSPARSSRRRAIAGIAAGSQPKPRKAASRWMPCCVDRRPATAGRTCRRPRASPVSLLGKRTPSSSPKAITSIANGSRSPARAAPPRPRSRRQRPDCRRNGRRRARCRCASRAGGPAARARCPRSGRRRWPAASTSTVIPASSIQPRTMRVAAAMGRASGYRRVSSPGLAGAAGQLMQVRHHVGAEGACSRQHVLQPQQRDALDLGQRGRELGRRGRCSCAAGTRPESPSLLRPLTAMMNGKPNLA